VTVRRRMNNRLVIALVLLLVLGGVGVWAFHHYHSGTDVNETAHSGLPEQQGQDQEAEGSQEGSQGDEGGSGEGDKVDPGSETGPDPEPAPDPQELLEQGLAALEESRSGAPGADVRASRLFRQAFDAAFEEGEPLPPETYACWLDRINAIAGYSLDLSPVSQVLIGEPSALVVKIDTLYAIPGPIEVTWFVDDVEVQSGGFRVDNEGRPVGPQLLVYTFTDGEGHRVRAEVRVGGHCGTGVFSGTAKLEVTATPPKEVSISQDLAGIDPAAVMVVEVVNPKGDNTTFRPYAYEPSVLETDKRFSSFVGQLLEAINGTLVYDGATATDDTPEARTIRFYTDEDEEGLGLATGLVGEAVVGLDVTLPLNAPHPYDVLLRHPGDRVYQSFDNHGGPFMCLAPSQDHVLRMTGFQYGFLPLDGSMAADGTFPGGKPFAHYQEGAHSTLGYYPIWQYGPFDAPAAGADFGPVDLLRIGFIGCDVKIRPLDEKQVLVEVRHPPLKDSLFLYDLTERDRRFIGEGPFMGFEDGILRYLVYGPAYPDAVPGYERPHVQAYDTEADQSQPELAWLPVETGSVFGRKAGELRMIEIVAGPPEDPEGPASWFQLTFGPQPGYEADYHAATVALPVTETMYDPDSRCFTARIHCTLSEALARELGDGGQVDLGALSETGVAAPEVIEGIRVIPRKLTCETGLVVDVTDVVVELRQPGLSEGSGFQYTVGGEGWSEENNVMQLGFRRNP